MELNTKKSLNTLNCILSNNDKYFFFNTNGKKLYNIEKIMENLNKRNGKAIVLEVCNIIKEKRIDMFEKILEIIGKDIFLNRLEKTLEIHNKNEESSKETNDQTIKLFIENNIGLKITKEELFSKTTGGIFIFLLKDEKYNKEFYNDIKTIVKSFKKEGKKKRKDIKQTCKELDNLNI